MSERPFWDVPFLLYIYGGWGNKPLLHLTVFYRIGLMDKNVHYSKMSKTLEKPRKSFPERWEPSQKRAGSASATCGGNDVRRSVRFSVRPWSGILPPHFGLLRFTADAYNRPNFGQLPCEPSTIFHTEIRRLHDFLHAEWVKTAQNGA